MEETQSRDPKRLQGWPFAGTIRESKEHGNVAQ